MSKADQATKPDPGGGFLLPLLMMCMISGCCINDWTPPDAKDLHYVTGKVVSAVWEGGAKYGGFVVRLEGDPRPFRVIHPGTKGHGTPQSVMRGMQVRIGQTGHTVGRGRREHIRIYSLEADGNVIYSFAETVAKFQSERRGWWLIFACSIVSAAVSGFRLWRSRPGSAAKPPP